MKSIGGVKTYRWLALVSGATLLGQSNCGVQIGDIVVSTFARTLSSTVGVFFQDIFSNLFMMSV